MEYADQISEEDAKLILKVIKTNHKTKDKFITDFLKEKYGFELEWNPYELSGYLCLEKRGLFTLILTILNIRYGNGIDLFPQDSKTTECNSEKNVGKKPPTVVKWRREFDTRENHLWGNHWGGSAKQGEGSSLARFFHTCSNVLSKNSKKNYKPDEIEVTLSNPCFTIIPSTYSLQEIEDYQITIKPKK